jgi:hypothetical protein
MVLLPKRAAYGLKSTNSFQASTFESNEPPKRHRGSDPATKHKHQISFVVEASDFLVEATRIST